MGTLQLQCKPGISLRAIKSAPLLSSKAREQKQTTAWVKTCGFDCLAAVCPFGCRFIMQKPIYGEHRSLSMPNEAHGATALLLKQNKQTKKQQKDSLWAMLEMPVAHTQADMVRLFAQPRRAPHGFPDKETVRSHRGGCGHLLTQHGCEIWSSVPSNGLL